MMYAVQNPLIGTTPIQLILGATDGLTPAFTPGCKVDAVDNYWGEARFIYAQATATIKIFSLVQLQPVYNVAAGQFFQSATAVANTQNLGTPAAVAMQAMTVGQWGWFAVEGLVPVWCSASVAAGAAIGIVAAGQGGAVAAGKSLLGAVVARAATTTVVKTNCASVPGSTTRLACPNTDGWFTGVALTGTGLGASCLLSSVDSDMRTATMSVAQTAAIAGSVTATYNDGTNFFNIVYLGGGAQFQGPIT